MCHESVAGYIATATISQLERRGIPADESMLIASSPDLIIGNQIKQPNMTVSPLPRKCTNVYADFEKNPFLNLIVEVALTDESVAILKQKMAVYLNRLTDAQMIIGIKI
jgi:hypothetical protein